MPVINLQMGQVKEEKKEALIKELTETAAKITGIPETHFVTFINEYPFENIGVGPKSLKQ